ncbi:related to nasopharyngeal carcinoma susceptibility protein LZ16 [Phialocephala subalpina]|uniref:Related to nasopharyngeal carcinoma susceptibility protein LZ16 n=1 Tax=Phialocephala subalpina TaxID=576137 RepID=A0A1L7WZD4_9HELO|nr:related to nasopharyngeal carcinoma susceptibility protein LZ16 [Phialocephala subalpina]
MRIPSWVVPLVLRLLSLTRLASAGGGNAAGDLRLGFGLGLVLNPTTEAENFPTATLSEPNVNGLSLDLDLFVRVGDCEFKTAIMPLHLLGKKSWNVYNTDNVERVKRDEAAAAAREAAEEERMQELDAERRMQILRGEIPTPLPIADTEFNESSKHDREGRGYGRERKRRKKAGENDTDFEMRVAREDADRSSALAESSQLVLRKDSSAPLTDHKGHISLFPESVPKGKEKNAEAEAEAAKKKKEYEDQYTMRFSNAAGFKQDIGSKPWYSKGDTIALAGRAAELENQEVVGKDVWGNEDPRRKERQTQRLVSSDPLAMMKAGAAQARQVEKERKKWREEKERELVALEKEERRKKRKRRHDDEDDLDDFRLDDDERRESRRREHREKDRSRDRERDHRRREKEATRGSHREDDRHRDRHRYSFSHRHRHHDR